MKNESNTPSSRRAIRKTCAFALAGLLATFCSIWLTARPVQAQRGGDLSNGQNRSEKEQSPKQPKQKFIGKKHHKHAIADEYIVVFTDVAAGPTGASSRAEEMAEELVALYGGKIRHKFKYAINGFAARMTEDQALAISSDARVAYVEQDEEMTSAEVGQWYPPSWGLDRVDQRVGLNSYYGYYGSPFNGAGVSVYVIDTGIRTSHTQFEGRASFVYDEFWNNGQDCFGHGTHVAGIIGGVTYGVAKRASLKSVRVMNCQGIGSLVITTKAVEWLTRNRRLPAVANMSLQYYRDETNVGDVGERIALKQAIERSIGAGITYVVAAGNKNVKACDSMPANSNAITVGATDRTDYRWVDSNVQGSNYGECVDIFAPGDSILSAGIVDDWDSTTMTGTSMAAPHVAGAAAMLLSGYPNATPAWVRSTILGTATPNRVWNAGPLSPNRLLFSRLTYN